MFNKQFLISTIERTLGTAAAAALGLLGVDGLTLTDVDWAMLGNVVALASLVTILKCVLAALPDGNPSIGSVEVIAKPGQTADPVTGGEVEVTDAVEPPHDLEGDYDLDEVESLS